MLSAPVVPFATRATDAPEEVTAAFIKFCDAGFDIRKTPHGWLLQKSRRYLSDDELVILARHLKPKPKPKKGIYIRD